MSAGALKDEGGVLVRLFSDAYVTSLIHFEFEDLVTVLEGAQKTKRAAGQGHPL